MDRRRFLALFGLTGGGIALLIPSAKSETGTVKVDVKSMRRDGNIITFKVTR